MRREARNCVREKGTKKKKKEKKNMVRGREGEGVGEEASDLGKVLQAGCERVNKSLN